MLIVLAGFVMALIGSILTMLVVSFLITVTCLSLFTVSFNQTKVKEVGFVT